MSMSSDQRITQSSAPLVSVIVPAYNAARYVGQAVESALSQTHGNTEVILVDDGSDDNTSEVVAPYLDRIRYVRQENSGVYAARNAGTRISRGDYVAFLDADDVWETGKLAAQVDVMEKQPEYGAVHTDTSTIDREGRLIRRSVNSRRQSKNGMVFEEFFEQNMAVILLSTVLIRRECFEALGDFDERFPMVTDYGFFLELAFRYPIGYIPESLVRYRMTPGSLSRRSAAENVSCRETILLEFIERHADYFGERPRLLKRKWRSFNREAAYRLFHNGEYRVSHSYFGKCLGRDPGVWGRYLLTFAPGTLLRRLRALRRRERET